MIGASVDLGGVNGALDRLVKNSRKNLRKAAQAGAQVYYDEIRARAPVSGKAHSTKGKKQTYQPGNLRAAIYQAFAEKQSGEDHSAYRISWNKSEAFYGRFIEYGTSKMAARPFFRPGADAARSKAISAVKEVLRESVKGGP